MICPRDKFLQIAKKNQGGLLVEIRNNMFKTGEYIHSSTHVPWDEIDLQWPCDLYAKKWSLSPFWNKDFHAPSLLIPIEVQYQLQERIKDDLIMVSDDFGIGYSFDLQAGTCMKKGVMYGLNYEPITNDLWKYYSIEIQPLPPLTAKFITNQKELYRVRQCKNQYWNDVQQNTLPKEVQDGWWVLYQDGKFIACALTEEEIVRKQTDTGFIHQHNSSIRTRPSA